jgi:flagellin-specific chaperone FliS
VVYALCKAPQVIRRQHPAALQQQLVPAFLEKCADANAQDISNVLYGMADSGQQLQEEAVQQLLAIFTSQLHQAKPQELSNTLWAVATMGQQVPAGQLQQLLAAFISQLHQANPQNVSNKLWAVATIGQQVHAGQLQQLFDALVDQLHQAKPQELSNMLWAVATMGQQVPAVHLQQLFDALVDQLQQAKPQGVSNTLWAVATMGQQVPAGQLQQLLDALVRQLHQAKPHEVSNTLLACAKLGFLPQHLLAAPRLAGLLAAGTPQHLVNAAWACGQLGHRDEQLMAALLAEVQQRLAAAGTSSIRRFNSQELCDLCWAVAVLDLQQHAQQVLQLGKACSSMWSSIEVERQQMWQAHTWLLDYDLAGSQGLQGSLTQQQLQQCTAAWDRQLRQTGKQRLSELQRSVFAAVQRLPIAWQQQPQMEQLSVGRDGVTPYGALLIDIAGRTAGGVLVAVDADGPTTSDSLMGG